MANWSGTAVSRALESPDEQRLCELFEQLRPKLVAFVRHRGMGNQAEDVVQETFIAALVECRAGNFDGRSSLQTWIYGILLHKIGDARRALARDDNRLAVEATTAASNPDMDTRMLVRE